MSFYLSTYLVYPNEVVTDDYLTGIPGYLIYDRREHADITFESEFEGMEKPLGKLVKMTKKKYADKFFEEGKLQLGTLEYFRAVGNPEIGDKTEGSLIIVGQSEIQTAFAEIGSGFDNYVFCCYDGEPNKKVIENFRYDDYFIITDPEGFAESIAKRLNVLNKIYSKCIYKKDKVLIGKTPKDFDFNTISQRLNDLVGKAKYFIKTENYKEQNEYRFMWQMNIDVKEPLIINCPEALNYCKRK